MGFFRDLFGPPKPTPAVIIRNVLGEEIDRVPGVSDLSSLDLRGSEVNLQITKRETHPRDARELYIQALWLLFLRAPHKPDSDPDGSYWLGEIGAERASGKVVRATPYSPCLGIIGGK